MNKLIFSSLMLLYLPLTAQAATEVEEKQQVLKMMRQYITLVSCDGLIEGDYKKSDTEAMKNIYTVEKDSDTSVYYVLWHGDMGCAGGSGTTSNFVTEVAKYGSWKPLSIQNDSAFGDIEINFRFVQGIKKVSQRKFEIISRDYADEKYGGKDGGMNFPANKFRYTVERERFEPWKITNQALLEQNN